MENIDNEMLLEEIDIPDEMKVGLRESDLMELSLRRQNVSDLRIIQKVIAAEAAQDLTLDEVLARLLSFYHRFVPFK